MTTRELLREKREEILALAAKHKAHNVRVFGSVARGEEGADSDTDLLADFDDDARLMGRLTLMVDLEDMLGRRVDVCSEGRLEPIIEAQVRREAAVL